MSTTSLTAGEVMDRSAALMNDPAKTDYTYVAQLPYLNMAIDELVESLEESNSSPTNMTSTVIPLAVGEYRITYPAHVVTPHYPTDLVEIQTVGERDTGTQNPFVKLVKRDFLQAFPVSYSLLYWHWEDQIIKFNPNGANVAKDIQLQYVRKGIGEAVNELSVIGTINAMSFLAYKTAALCSEFIGENKGRADALDIKAEAALERLTGINNKGRQQIMTRHRPFRAAYKARGGY
jgi:hypothetical protein